MGLALVAFTKLPLEYYRQGTILVLDPEQPREFKYVKPDGTRADAVIRHEDALSYAQTAAKDFGVGKSKMVPFDAAKAKTAIAEAKKKKKN